MRLGKEQTSGYAEDQVASVADAEAAVGMTAPSEPGPVPAPQAELERAPAG
jgi:hypothetical protein